jgi:hypothetical protein
VNVPAKLATALEDCLPRACQRDGETAGEKSFFFFFFFFKREGDVGYPSRPRRIVPLARLGIPVTPLPCGVQPHRPLRAPTRRLRRLAASSFVVGPHRRAGQFALPAPAPSGTAFNRESFGPYTAWYSTEITFRDLPAAVDLLRPSAEEA